MAEKKGLGEENRKMKDDLKGMEEVNKNMKEEKTRLVGEKKGLGENVSHLLSKISSPDLKVECMKEKLEIKLVKCEPMDANEPHREYVEDYMEDIVKIEPKSEELEDIKDSKDK